MSTDLETRLRASLADRARQAPPGGPLSERILAELDVPSKVLRPRRPWRSWSFPLLAAAAIAAVALTVIGLSTIRFSAAPGPAATHQRTATAQPSPQSTPQSATVTPAPPPPTPTLQPVPGLPTFRAIDTTYVGSSQAWALGAVACHPASRQTCPALATTGDAGKSWTELGLPSGVELSSPVCGAGCVRGIRFATDKIGFLFGPATFWTTADGGRHWQHRPGGAVALETLDNTVIRVEQPDPSCTASCRYVVRYSDIETRSWHAARLPALVGDTVQLLRAKGTSYLLVLSGDSGRLFHSSDGGADWTREKGCPGMRQVALNAGSLDLFCAGSIRVQADTPQAHYVAVPTSGDLAAVGAHTLFISGDRLWRSTDSGRSWDVVLDVSGGDGPPGFQSETLGRWVTDGGRTIWTTHDGGATWSGLTFSR